MSNLVAVRYAKNNTVITALYFEVAGGNINLYKRLLHDVINHYAKVFYNVAKTKYNINQKIL